MEVITFDSETFKEIMKNLLEIRSELKQRAKLNPLSETWLDISEACQLLKISKRLLQSYRDNRILSFSQINGKIYFRASDIESLLNSHYIDKNRRK